MVCLTVTISVPKATIISFTFVGFQDPDYLFKLVLGSGLSGSIRTSVDGTQIGSLITPIVKYQYDMLFTLTPGTHSVCVEIV